MSSDIIINLLQIILLTVATVVVMLVTAFKRDHALISGLTQFGLFAALTIFLFVQPVIPLDVTPLLYIDHFSLFFSSLIILAAMAVTGLAYPYFSGPTGIDREGEQNEEFYLLLLMATLGGVVLASSQHFVTFLLGMETLSISLYAMIAYPVHSNKKTAIPLEASIKYLILSAAASGVMLFGMALLYAETGSLGFEGMSLGLLNGSGSIYMIAGLLMLLAGVSFKLSLVPFHMWTPDVYEGAPVPVTAFIATVSKAAMMAVLIRLFIVADLWQVSAVVQVLILLSAVSMIAGNLLALLQSNVKRLLAYSSIAHLGYLMMVVIAGVTTTSSLTLEASGYYIAAYVLTTLAAFAVVSAMSSDENESCTLADFKGLFWRKPWLAVVMTTALLSLAGIPLTMGFIGKFYIINSGVEAQTWGLLGVLVVGSSIGLYYYLRLIYLMLQNSTSDSASDPAARSLPISVNVVLTLTGGAILFYGVYPSGLIDHLQLLVSGFN